MYWCFPLVVDTLFALCIVVCDGFVLSPVGSWSYFRVFICFCTAVVSCLVFYGFCCLMCSMDCIQGVYLFLVMLRHVLSSTAFVVWCVLWGVFRGCICF